MITKKAKDSQKRMKMRCRKITEMGIQKSVKMQMGEVGVKISHDRNGEYKPKIIAKYDRNVDRMEEKSLGLYACGMSQRDIADQIKS
ncbi:MAG: transposase, partial [Ruthenibacterium sp.]